MKQRAPVVTIVLLIGLGFWCQACIDVSAQEPFEREYLISTDPIQEVFKVQSFGGMTNWYRVYTVFADGRLVLEFVSAVDSEVKRRHKMQLSYDELDSLISVAVHGGLIEHDHEPFTQKLRMYTSGHDSEMRFEINIEQYKGPGQEEWGPASCSISIRNALSAPRHFPDVQAFQALATLTREFRKYRKIMEEHDAN